MPDHETSEDERAETSSDVPPEQRGAAGEQRVPEPEPVGDRPGGAGSAGGQVLESPGGPATVQETHRDDQVEQSEDKTLVEELVEEEEREIGEISPDMGTIQANPQAGGSRFDELVEKRRKGGLSDDDADELGRLMAERDGREWTSTRSLRVQPPDAS